MISMLTIVVFNDDSLRDNELSQMLAHDGIDSVIVRGTDRYQAYNSIIDKVRTEYIWFADNSIRVTKEELGKIMNHLSSGSADFYAFDYTVCYSDGRNDLCHSNLYHSSPSRLVTMYSREKHYLFLSSMIFHMPIIRDNTLSFIVSAGIYAHKLFAIECLQKSGKAYHMKDVTVSFSSSLDREDYCRKPEYTKQRIEQYKVYFDRLSSTLSPQDVMFLEDDCFLFKDECSINGVLSKLKFNRVIPLPYAAIRRNAWSYRSLLKLTLVYVLNKFL